MYILYTYKTNHISPSGNRTHVATVRGLNINHYTMRDSCEKARPPDHEGRTLSQLGSRYYIFVINAQYLSYNCEESP